MYVASLSFSTVYYVLRRQTNRQLAQTLVANLERLVTVVAVDAATVQQAIVSSFTDFEDALQHYAAALAPTVEGIVTRNTGDFTHSTLPVLTPAQALTDLSRP